MELYAASPWKLGFCGGLNEADECRLVALAV
jgi:hypothetical protein